MTSKLYAYVDESAAGRVFIVAVVIVGTQRDDLAALCEQIEQDTSRRNKWSRTADALNLAYMRRALDEVGSLARLCVVSYPSAEDQTAATVDAIARAIEAQDLPADYKVTVLYDGLPKSQHKEIGAMLRKRRVLVRKVRGVRDESEPLTRLADAVAGLMRDATQGKPEARDLLNAALRRGVLREV